MKTLFKSLSIWSNTGIVTISLLSWLIFVAGLIYFWNLNLSSSEVFIIRIFGKDIPANLLWDSINTVTLLWTCISVLLLVRTMWLQMSQLTLQRMDSNRDRFLGLFTLLYEDFLATRAKRLDSLPQLVNILRADKDKLSEFWKENHDFIVKFLILEWLVHKFFKRESEDYLLYTTFITSWITNWKLQSIWALYLFWINDWRTLLGWYVESSKRLLNKRFFDGVSLFETIKTKMDIQIRVKWPSEDEFYFETLLKV